MKRDAAISVRFQRYKFFSVFFFYFFRGSIQNERKQTTNQVKYLFNIQFNKKRSEGKRNAHFTLLIHFNDCKSVLY